MYSLLSYKRFLHFKIPYLFELGYPVRKPNLEGSAIIRNIKITIFFMLLFAQFLLGNNVNTMFEQ